MKQDTQLDYAIFQLTPTRTRCELHVVAQGMTYKLASGLLKPFVAHLRAAEEQLAKGGYSIRLEPPDPHSASWFTKGTMERFVRFVSTPEVLERVSTVEIELIELDEAISQQTKDADEANELVPVDDQSSKVSQSSTGAKVLASANLEKPVVTPTKTRRESMDGTESGVEGENTKQRLLRAMEARRLMLQKEQGMAFARAIAAGFSVEHMGDLVVFAECFGANRLREACIKFTALCKKRQEAGLWLEDLDLAAAEAGSTQSDMPYMGVENAKGSYLKSREFPDAWSDIYGREMQPDDPHRAGFPAEGRFGGDGASWRGSLDDPTGDYWQWAASMRPANGPMMMGDFNGEFSPMARARNRPGRNQLTPEDLQAVAASYLGSSASGMGFLEGHIPNGEYMDPGTGRGPGVVRGQPFMEGWQGQPQGQYMQNIDPHALHGTIHPSFNNHLESPYGSAGPGRGPPPVLPYPHYMGSQFMQPPYVDSNRWQATEASPNWMGHVQSPLPAQYQPGNQGHVDNSMVRDPVDGGVHVTQHGGDEDPARPTVHRTDPNLAQQSIIHSNTQETIHSPNPKLSGNHSQIDDPRTPEYADRNETMESPVDTPAELPAETRRLPRRSASPSRRSSSPMRKVQIGRSGGRRSGMVVIRNINYIAPNSQDRSSKGDDGGESSGSWSEEDNSGASGQDDETLQSKAESVRVRVQDVIGLFENKKSDPTDARKKPSKRESRSSKKDVLRRWTDPGEAKDEGHDGSTETAGGIAKDGAFAEEASMFTNRVGHRSLDSSAHDVAELESKAGGNFTRKEAGADMIAGQTPEDMLMLPSREAAGNKTSSDLYSTEGFVEQQGRAKQREPIADDSFILSDRAGLLGTGSAADRRSIDPDFELATGDSEQQAVDKVSLDDSFIVLDRPSQDGASLSWRTSLNLESEMPLENPVDRVAQAADNFEPDDLFMMPERNKESASRSWNTPVDYDMQLMDSAQAGREQQSVEDGQGVPSENGVQEVEDEKRGAKPKETSSKRSEREAKAKAMQEMLERRKAGTSKRSDKLNPLAEAQLRAEKLRAYKAGLQKTKKEKEEEERKRIEDLKNQRRERIAARSSPGSNGAQSASPTPRGLRSQAPAPLSISNPSPTSSHKLSGSSPRGSIINGASSLSPNVTTAKVSNGSRLPRTLQTPKSAENPLSRSVPSLSELRKETRKTTPAVRASTGSQRLSQLKNSEKSKDSTISANGHVESKKHQTPTTAARKGSPATKETKAEGSPAVNPPKSQSGSSKQQKTAANAGSNGNVAKPSLRRATASGTATAAVASQQAKIDANETDDNRNKAPPTSLLPERNAKGTEQLETTIDAAEAADPPVIEAGERAGADNGFVQIRAPASTEAGNTITVGEEARGTDQLNETSVASDAPAKVLEELTEDTSNLDANVSSSLHRNPQSEYPIAALTDSQDSQAHLELNDDEDGDRSGEDYEAPIAHVSSADNDSPACLETDLNDTDEPSVSTEVSTNTSTGQYNPPFAPLTQSPLATPSKNLPRLLDAIQQAHSPEASPVNTESARSRKKWGDSGSQKTSKGHAKGFKRLLMLGRKSSRSPVQSSSDWVSASTTSEGDDDGDEVRELPSSIGKNVGLGSALDSNSSSEQVRSSVPAQYHFKPQYDNVPGSSSTKASRSFFSLSTFRSKSGEVKTA